MVIDQIVSDSQHQVLTVAARITWDIDDREPFNLFAQTIDNFSDAFWGDPNALLLACLLPAWKAGERVVKVAAPLCPLLCHNVQAALAALRFWYPQLGPPPRIESTTGFEVLQPSIGSSMSLLSCGIDSLATVRWNMLNVPRSHPHAIRGTLSVSHDQVPASNRNELTGRLKGRSSAAISVATDAGASWIPLSTNMWWLVNNGYFFDEKWHSALFSAAAYFFSRGYQRTYIASSHYRDYFDPWGSHPLVDPWYSSGHFEVRLEGVGTTRLQKTALVAAWPVGLNAIRVCQVDNKGRKNCGRCEKCIQTTLALTSLGKLSECESFPSQTVESDLIDLLSEYNMIEDDECAEMYEVLFPGLVSHGRQDLVAALGRVLEHYRRTRTVRQ